MSDARQTPQSAAEVAVWQDVEFGAYTADLELWEELARSAPGPVLELGAGSGRVALHLAGAGSEVLALERDPEMAEELRRRTNGLPLQVVAADIEAQAIDTPAPGCVIAPLHVLQQIDARRRGSLLGELVAILPAGGRFAATLVDEGSLFEQGAGTRPTPDMREVEGFLYSSEPLWVQLGVRALTVRRLRERVSPGGEIERSVHDEVLVRLSPDELEREGADAGFAAVARRELRSGPHEADSIAVIMEAGR